MSRTLNDIFPSKYLKANDLPDEGSQHFTIEKVEIEEIGRNKETKPVIYFNEIHKGLVANKTNCRTIATALGTELLDDWIGKQISLYRAEVEFQGEMVEAIRVKLKSPKKQVDEDGDTVPF